MQLVKRKLIQEFATKKTGVEWEYRWDRGTRLSVSFSSKSVTLIESVLFFQGELEDAIHSSLVRSCYQGGKVINGGSIITVNLQSNNNWDPLKNILKHWGRLNG